MLRIITGRAGSGKSGKCITEFNSYIQKHTAPEAWAYLFVPEQYTMLTERRLLEFQIDEKYDVLGIIGHEVLNFKRFTHRVLSLYGGGALPSLSESGKIMLLTAACARLSGKLKYFTTLAERPAEIGRMLSLIEELGRYSVNSNRLKEIDTQNTYFEQKLSDIILITEEYGRLKKGRYSDENDLFERMLEHIDKNRFFEKRPVWIDSFTGFTNSELELIRLMLRQSECVTVTLCTDLSGDPAFECVDKTYAILKNTAYELGTDVSVINMSAEPGSNRYKYTSPGLHALEQSVSKARAVRSRDTVSGATLYECLNPYDEVERCALRIKELYDNEHIEYKHMAVALRNISGYGAIIRSIFSKYEIPYYIDSKKNINNNPFIKTVLSLLSIISDDWQIRDVLECLKADIIMRALVEIQDSASAPDIMENEILRLGIRGSYKWRRAENEFCKIFYGAVSELSSAIGECRILSEVCAAVCSFIVKLHIKEIIEASADELRGKGEAVLADEYSRIWDIFTEVMEQITLFLGNTTVKGSRDAASVLLRYLSAGLSQYRIGFIPPDMQSVQIMEIERSRSADIKALFLLNANDGIIPAHFTDDGILKDSERELLCTKGIELADDSEAKSSKENYYIYTMLSLPSDRLEVSWTAEDISGNSQKPSSLIIRKIRGVFPDININKFKMAESDILSIPGADRVNIDRDVNSLILRLDGVLRTSVSKMEAYYKCPYAFWLTYGLGLKKREETSIESYDLGNVMHSIVDCASESLITLPKDSESRVYEELVESVYDKASSDMRFQARELTEREKHALKRIRKYAVNTLYNIKRHIEAGSFRTAGYETPFGGYGPDSLKAIELIPDNKTPELEKIRITGRIDRYDVLESDGRFYVRVIDYKSSDKTLSESEISAGTKLQLITYLNAVVDSYPDNRAVPAGALYFTFGTDIASEKKHMLPGEIPPALKKGSKMNGFVLNNDTVLTGMTGGTDTGVIGGRLASGTVHFKDESKMLKTEEEFEIMKNTVFGNIKKAAEAIAGGHYSIEPSDKADTPPCRYCEMFSICANSRKLE